MSIQVRANSLSKDPGTSPTTFKALLIDRWDYSFQEGRASKTSRIMVQPCNALRCMVGNHDFTHALGKLWPKGNVVCFAIYLPWAPKAAADLIWTGPGNKRSKVWERLRIRGRAEACMVSMLSPAQNAGPSQTLFSYKSDICQETYAESLSRRLDHASCILQMPKLEQTCHFLEIWQVCILCISSGACNRRSRCMPYARHRPAGNKDIYRSATRSNFCATQAYAAPGLSSTCLSH